MAKRTIVFNCILLLIAVAGFVVLTRYSLNLTWYENIWQVKLISVASLYTLVAGISVMLMKNKSLDFKLVVACITALLLTAGIFFMNNWWNFAKFSSIFDWPEDVKYWSFVMDNVTYSYGFNMIRNVALFAFYIFIFSVINSTPLKDKCGRLIKYIMGTEISRAECDDDSEEQDDSEN